MRPENLHTKIFLDSGDPAHTREILELLGFLDGQTTNPSLVAKSPAIAQRFEGGEKLRTPELLNEYKKIVHEIAELIPNKSVSVEVYADENTSVSEILEQAHEMNQWVSTAHVKIPTIPAGLEAAEQLIREGMNLNFTLIFNQEQAAAIATLARSARPGQIFLSPFVGRLDDTEVEGLYLIENIQRMYQSMSSPVEVLAASIRDVEHLKLLLAMKVDIVTVPFTVLKEWAEQGALVPENPSNIETFIALHHDESLEKIPYKEFELKNDWRAFGIAHHQTDTGLRKFADDWNKLITD